MILPANATLGITPTGGTASSDSLAPVSERPMPARLRAAEPGGATPVLRFAKTFVTAAILAVSYQLTGWSAAPESVAPSRGLNASLTMAEGVVPLVSVTIYPRWAVEPVPGPGSTWDAGGDVAASATSLGCDGRFRPAGDDALISGFRDWAMDGRAALDVDRPLGSLGSSALVLTLRRPDGRIVGQRPAVAQPGGRLAATLTVEAAGDYVVELGGLPQGWEACPGHPTRQPVPATRFDPATGVAAVAMAIYRPAPSAATGITRLQAGQAARWR